MLPRGQARVAAERLAKLKQAQTLLSHRATTFITNGANDEDHKNHIFAPLQRPRPLEHHQSSELLSFSTLYNTTIFPTEGQARRR